jgi:RNA polymerase sigma factor (sigma-70 family)
VTDLASKTPPRPADAKGAARPLSHDARRDLGELYRLYCAELVRFVTRTFGPGPPDPEDAAQAAFEHYAALDDSSIVYSPRAFLYRSARNFVLDQKRRMKVRARFAKGGEVSDFAELTDDLDAERVLDAKERLAILNEAIQQMEPRLREVFILNRIHELSHAEISRRKRISETQSKRLVALAMIICERALKKAERHRGREQG